MNRKSKKSKNPVIQTLRDKDISLADGNYYTKYILDPYAVPKMDLGGFIGDINNQDEYTEFMRNKGILPNFAPDPNQIGQNIPQQFQTQPIESDMSNAIPGFNDRINQSGTNNTNSTTNTTGQSIQNTFDKLPSFQASTKPIIDTLSAFSNIYYSNQMKQDEMRRMRKTLAPVTSPQNFMGNDMPLYQKNGGIVVQDLGYNGTQGLTQAQIDVLNGGPGKSTQNVTPPKPADYRKLPNAPQWVQDNALSAFTKTYIGSGRHLPNGDYVTGQPYVGPNYSGSNWATNVQAPTDIRNIDLKGPAYTSNPNGSYNINMNKIYKEGGQVNSPIPSNINPNTKSKKGYTAKDFEVDPSLANVIAENGEFIQFPDGSTAPIYGDKHYDSSGGEHMNLPEGSRIYSESIKADSDFSSDLLGRKVKKKLSISDLAKKFDTSKSDETLNNTRSTELEKRTASINKELKTAKLDEVFNYQEMIKNPMSVFLNDIRENAPVIAADGGTVGKPLRGGWLGEGNIQGYSQDQINEYNDVMYNIAMGTGYTGPRETQALQEYVFNTYPNLTQDFFTNRVPPTNRAVTQYGVTNAGVPNPDEMGKLSQNQVIDTAVDNIPGVRTFMPQYPVFDDVDPYMAAKSGTPIQEGSLNYYPTDVVPSDENMPYIYQNPRLNINPIEGAGLPTVNTNITANPVTIPNRFTNVSVPEVSNPSNPNTPKRKRGVRNNMNFGGIGDMAPEIFGAIQALNEFPVFTAKYQPNYLRPTEVNIQDNLNRNQSAAAPLLEAQGNPAIANARAQQAAANLFDANNTAFQSKYNMDNQNRQQVAQYNNQLENQANLTNLQRADDFWNKVTARQANKERDLNTVVNSAYAKAKNRQMEKRSLDLANQMFPNFKYDGNNLQFVKDSQGNLFNVGPNGSLQPLNTAIIEGDGRKTSVTESVDSKGKKKRTTRTVEDPNR